MPVTTYYTIVSLTAPSSWIALIIAFVVAYGAVRFRFGKKNAEALLDAFFYFIVVWKLSVLVVDFKLVLQSPLSLLYFNGGIVGYTLGIVGAAGKFLWDKKKGRMESSASLAVLTGVVLAQAVFQVSMVFLNEGEWTAQVVTVVGFSLFSITFWINSQKSVDWQLQLIGLFMFVHLFIASIQPGTLFNTALLTNIGIGIYFIWIFGTEKRHELRMEEQL